MRITAIMARPDEHTGPRAKLLSDLGHDVEIVCFQRNPALNLRQHVPGSHQPVPWPLSASPSLARLVRFHRLLRQAEGEIWHVQFARGFHAFLAAVARRVPLIVSTMGGDIMFDERPENTLLVRFLVRRLLKSADGVTGKSEHSLEQIRRLGVSPDKIHKIAWGVDPGQYEQVDASHLRGELGIPNAATVLFSVRALRELYNIDVIIEAFARLCRDSDDLILLVTRQGADPAYEQALRHRVDELGLQDRVRFIDPVRPERMVEYYSLSDIVIGIPRSDGLPQSMLEAMSCRRIVVVPDDPRYRTFVTDGETGFLADRTVESLHAVLRQALAAKEQWSHIGAAARRRIECSANSLDEGRKFESVLQRCLEANHDRGWLEATRSHATRLLMLVGIALFAVYPFFVTRAARISMGPQPPTTQKTR